MPKTPADLAAHDCIFGPGKFGRESWTFLREGTRDLVDVRGRIHTDSGPGVLASAVAGLGIAIASNVMCAAEVKRGVLLPILTGYALKPVERLRGISRRAASLGQGPRAGGFPGGRAERQDAKSVTPPPPELGALPYAAAALRGHTGGCEPGGIDGLAQCAGVTENFAACGIATSLP